MKYSAWKADSKAVQANQPAISLHFYAKIDKVAYILYRKLIVSCM